MFDTRVFLRIFFEKVDFERNTKKQQTTKRACLISQHAKKYSCMNSSLLHVWLVVWTFIYFHTLYVWKCEDAGSAAQLHWLVRMAIFSHDLALFLCHRKYFDTIFFIWKQLCKSYTMACPPVCGDNPQALANGLSYTKPVCRKNCYLSSKRNAQVTLYERVHFWHNIITSIQTWLAGSHGNTGPRQPCEFFPFITFAQLTISCRFSYMNLSIVLGDG